MSGIVPHQYEGTGAPKPTLEDFLTGLALPDNLGASQDGEYELRGIGIGDPSKPAVLIAGAMHGSEWESSRSAARMIEIVQLPENTWLLDHLYFYVVPVANPWGYANVRRQNSRNVDPERNWDNLWETGDPDPEGSRWRGTAPFSEAEIIIMRDLILSLEPVAVLDVHGWGGYDRSSMAPTPHPRLWRTPQQVADRCGLAAGLSDFVLYPFINDFQPSMFNWARYQTTSSLGFEPFTFLFEIGSQIDLAEQERQGVMTILQTLYDLGAWMQEDHDEPADAGWDYRRRAQYYEYL